MPQQQSLIADSYRHVGRISKRSGSNFYRSFWLLPRSKRQAMHALYAFARITDDLGDCDQPATVRTRWLTWWRATTALNVIKDQPLERVLLADENDVNLGHQTNHGLIDLKRHALEILPALADATRRYRIPSRYLLEIIDGVLADQQKTRFDTYEQVEHYCYLVASAVGLACMHIWEFEEPMSMTAAVDCGLGFQWTNILRDITEDAARGRLYLPRQHYELHGLSEDDLLHPRPDDRLCCLISDEAERARQLFSSGWQVWDSLHPDGQPMFSMMWRTYRKLLGRIIDNPSLVLTRRVRLTKREKIGLISQHFLPVFYRRLPMPPIEVK